VLKYVTLFDALGRHDEIVAKSGGLQGTKDEGLIDSILSHMQNDDYYPDFASKLTHLVFSIIKNHAFNDGNKRTSIMLGATFMRINDFGKEIVDNFVVQMEDVVVAVAENKIDKHLLNEILVSLTTKYEYSDELQSRINNAIS
jgi:death-on-curing protein